MKHEERKIKAVELMKQLGIYKPYIKDFQENDTVCFYENFAGFWAWQNEELNKKIKEIESKYNCTVYAVTHEFTEFGECYSMLYVPRYKQEWNNLLVNVKGTFYTYAYVWNKSDDWCSEFGEIGVKIMGGGIKRVA